MNNNLLFCSFIGVDQYTSPHTLRYLDYITSVPLEFGVLYSISRAGISNRYPSLDVINDFKKQKHGNTAIHLCGSVVHDFLDGADYTKRLCDGFNRVQLNFDTNTYQPLHLIEMLRARQSEGRKMIIQYHDRNASLINNYDLSGIDILFDNSGGLGNELKDPMAAFPSNLCGYAGGINGKNVKNVLARINAVNINTAYYIDMESGLRDSFDKFNIDRCLDVLEALHN